MTTLQTLFAYKAWANDELLTVLGGIDASAHPTVLHSAVSSSSLAQAL